MAMESGAEILADMGNWVKHIVHENKMEVKIAATAIVALVLWQIVFKRLFSGSKSRPKLPPGPLNLPLVGAIFSLEANIYGWYRKMARKYGKIFYFRLGSHGVLVVCSVAGAEEVLKTKDAIFANRPNKGLMKSASKYIVFNSEDIVFDNFTERQKNLKKLLVNSLFSISELNRFEYVRRREGAYMVESIQGQIKSGRIIEVGHGLMENAVNVISSLISRRRFTDALTSESDELKHCNKVIKTATDLFLKTNLGDLFPWLAWADIQGLNKEFTEYNQLCCKVIEQIVEEHKEARRRNKNYVDEDIVDILLNRQEEGKLSDNAIRGCILNLLVGGTDTHANTTEWALLELAKNSGSARKREDRLEIGSARKREDRLEKYREFDIAFSTLLATCGELWASKQAELLSEIAEMMVGSWAGLDELKDKGVARLTYRGYESSFPIVSCLCPGPE